LFCLLADPINIRKLVCIQNEIKREKELYLKFSNLKSLSKFLTPKERNFGKK